METYRNKLKLQNLGIAVVCIVMAVFCFLGAAGVLKPIAGDSHWVDRWNGFVSGVSFGILLVAIFFLIRNILALCNDKWLKKIYVKDKDERSHQIWSSAQASGLRVSLIAEIVASVVAGYFSVTVSLTIFGCMTAQALICHGFRLYYNMKY